MLIYMYKYDVRTSANSGASSEKKRIDWQDTTFSDGRGHKGRSCVFFS